MRQLLVLLVIVGVGYLLYTQGLPKWEQQKAAQAADEADAGQSVRCVDMAQGVVSDFTSGMRQFSAPPVDRNMWGSWLLSVGGDLSSAEGACSCPTPACDKGGAALHQLRGLLGDLPVRSQRRITGPGRAIAARLDQPAAGLRAHLVPERLASPPVSSGASRPGRTRFRGAPRHRRATPRTSQRKPDG